jgi:SpoVK/Ycf46/Vps4 family AAA+-type ATPase
MSAVLASPETRALLPVGKVGAAVAAFETAKKIRNEARGYWRENFAYTVSVSEGDPLYSDVHAWLLSIMPEEKHRTLLVSSGGHGSRPVYEDEPEDRKPSPLTVRFDDEAPRKVIIAGHKAVVRIQRPETPDTSQGYGRRDPNKIEFVVNTYAGQQAIIRELEQINSEKATTRKAVLRMVNSWGDWTTRSDLPPRTLDSVSIPEEQMNKIVSDIERFLAAEDRYNRLAIPWHRGYMFHGPPGTGKTSLVKALSNHFNLDLWYISLSDLKAEAGLMGLLSGVGPRSILLLEDIDTIKITHDRDSSDQGTISTSGLLNALDGVATPHGLITMMTTNRLEVLDDALTRTGRMDMIEELTWPSRKTLAQMYRHFFGQYPVWVDLNDDTPITGLSTAQVAETLKQHLDSPVAAELAVAAQLNLL